MTKQYNNALSHKLINTICYGRLTLESGVPISSTDQTAKTTLFFTPYNGDVVGLYDGSEWDLFEFNELSLSLSGLAANTNFDIFIYNNNGVLTLEATAWTNDSTRATGLAFQDGVYVRSNATTRRYLGTIRTTGTIGQCEDSTTRRLVWNLYNQTTRHLYTPYSAAHTYTTSAWRPFNNNTTIGQGRHDYVLGLTSYLTLMVQGQANSACLLAAGVDTTTSPASPYGGASTALANFGFVSQVTSILGAGYHFTQSLEYGYASGSLNGGYINTTIYGQ